MKDDSNRSLRHLSRKSGKDEDRTVVVDSSAFFSETPSEPTPPPRRPAPPQPPRNGGRRTPPGLLPCPPALARFCSPCRAF